MAATETETEIQRDTLHLLMAAALALPGMAASADPNVRSDVVAYAYNHASYSESAHRMDVRTDQASLTVPLGDRYELRLNAIHDVTTGASPSINLLVNGKLISNVDSAASIRDVRKAFDAGASYYGDAYFAGVNIGHSAENDYISKFVSGSYRRYFNEKATTLEIGASYDDDSSWEKFYPKNIYSQDVGAAPRFKHELLVGVSQILDANSVLQLSLGHAYSYGALSEHYRAALLMPAYVGIEDARPDHHRQWTALARYSRYLEGLHSAIHLDYRYGHDSWGANSHTLEGKLRVGLGSGWSVSPGLRYYTQKNAEFYQLFFTALPANHLASADYRLAAFGAASAKLEAIKVFKGGYLLRASGENYVRKKSYMAGKGIGDAIDDYRARTLSVSVEGGF